MACKYLHYVPRLKSQVKLLHLRKYLQQHFLHFRPASTCRAHQRGTRGGDADEIPALQAEFENCVLSMKRRAIGRGHQKTGPRQFAPHQRHQTARRHATQERERRARSRKSRAQRSEAQRGNQNRHAVIAAAIHNRQIARQALCGQFHCHDHCGPNFNSAHTPSGSKSQRQYRPSRPLWRASSHSAKLHALTMTPHISSHAKSGVAGKLSGAGGCALVCKRSRYKIENINIAPVNSGHVTPNERRSSSIISGV